MSNYYLKELHKPLHATLDTGELPTLKVTSSSGETKSLSINLESLDSIRFYLDTVERKLQGVK
jgi:hypothetical protein